MPGFVMRLNGWWRAAGVYKDRRVLAITFLGISSGFPLGILGDPLTAWLQEYGLSKTTIGLFGLASLPYSLKFLWAPALDGLRLPVLTARFGRRRSWAIFTQIALLAAVASLGRIDLPDGLYFAAAITLAIAFFSASQDIVIDAYRVEILDERQLGAGAATVVFGYRLGQVGAGAMGLIVAAAFGWEAAFGSMAVIALIGMAAILLCPEPALDSATAAIGPFSARLKRAVVAPLTDFFGRPAWLMILGVIVFYKLGDAVLSVMQTPFFLEIGFSKPEIAGIKKGVGLAAVIGGGFLGGVLVAGWGIMRSLLVCGVLQALSNLVFVYQAWAGHDLAALTLTVAVENLATGMGSTAFVAYLSSLCNHAYTATQYALLTSVMGGARTVLSASAGWLADRMDWASFFMLTTAAAVPGLVLIVCLMRRFPGVAENKTERDRGGSP
jgi:PAT family beta-lactamase induction signal transducer AmpG